MAISISILGAGITGLTTALALQRHLPDPKPQLTIYEIRDAPSNIGGAVNLTPKALRYLDYLGIDVRALGVECQEIQLFNLYSGVQYAAVDFRGSGGKGIGKQEQKQFYSARVMRRELQEALLQAVEKQSNITVRWGMQIDQIEDLLNDKLRLTFKDGQVVLCDLLLGCDGIHSAARTLLVEPERKPVYSGIAVSMATTEVPAEVKLKWETTGLASSRRGSFMASFYEKSKTEQYVGIITEVNEVPDREGWKVLGSDQKAVKEDLLARFESESMPELAGLIQAAGDWSLYPVYKLPPKGLWTSSGNRCILLGDAAHAMPPQGESTGICIEDAIVFSRAMMHYQRKPLASVLASYERFRRPQIDAAVTEANWRWETAKDGGAIAFKMKLFATPWFLWWTAKAREQELSVDYTDYDFQL